MNIPSFNSIIQKSIKENWDLYSMTDKKSSTLQ